MSPEDNLRRILDMAFGRINPATAKQAPPTTTDKPAIKLFMLQMMNEFAPNCGDGLRWEKTFRHKKSGKNYSISVEMLEVTPSDGA